MPGRATVHHEKRVLEIPVFPQPVRLRRQVPVKDVAFLILETPRDDDEDVAFPDPRPFLDLAFNPSHPFNSVLASDPDMVCSQHQSGAGKLFAVLLLWQANTDNRRPVGVKFCNIF